MNAHTRGLWHGSVLVLVVLVLFGRMVWLQGAGGCLLTGRAAVTALKRLAFRTLADRVTAADG